MHFFNYFAKTLNMFIISEISLLIFAFIAKINHSKMAIYLIYFMLYLAIVFILYEILYNWRKVEKSPVSFLRFLLVCCQFVLYCFALRICLFPIIKPIYLEDLSILSQYRYLILSFISIIGIIYFFLLSTVRPEWSSYLDILIFPYLKEEIRVFLYTWNNSFLGDICSKIIDLLYKSIIYVIIFFIIQFIMLLGFRIYATLILWHCILFHGDFRLLINLAPIFFLIWIFSFFNYYFLYFREGCANYIRSLLNVSKKDTLQTPTKFGIIKTTQKNLNFELTPLALEKNASSVDMQHLIQEWHIQAQVASYFFVYHKISKYFRFILLIFQIFAWAYIAIYFFFPSIFRGMENPNYFGIFSKGNILSRPFCRPYASEIRRVKLHHQNDLSKATDGVHKGNHPCVVDPADYVPQDPTQILYEGQPTHGKGSAQNPSLPLHPTKDINGLPKPQNFIPPKEKETYIPETWIESNKHPNSDSFLREPKVKENMAKHSPKEQENT